MGKNDERKSDNAEIAVLKTKMDQVEKNITTLWEHRNDMEKDLANVKEGMAKYKIIIAICSAVGSLVGGGLITILVSLILKSHK